jgi:hypothetical protein
VSGDAYAPDNGPDAGKVIVEGRTLSPTEARAYGERLIGLADFAEEVAHRNELLADIVAEETGTDTDDLQGFGASLRPSSTVPAAHYDDGYTGGLMFGRPLGPWAG